MAENAVLCCNTGKERKRGTRNFRDSGCLIVKYKNDLSCNRDSIDRNILATSKILQMTVYESLMSLQCWSVRIKAKVKVG